MAFQSTTGLGVPTQIVCLGNDPNVKGSQKVRLSVGGTTYPTTFQLEPVIQDAGGNPLSAGTAFTLTAVAASSSPAVLVLTSVAAPSNGQAAYTGTITGGGSNAYIGQEFIVAGFAGATNNGTFVVAASTTTVLTLINGAAVAETHAATATSESGVAIYTGTITGGGSNAFAGETFVVAGFAGANNNGTFFATASSATTLTLGNNSATAETHAATATNEEATALTYVVYGASTNSKGTSPIDPTGTKVAIATVSATGLLTAVAKGGADCEISFPTFNNTGGNVSSSGNVMNGLPINKIYKELNIVVFA